jgi:general L-amino acid transport system substrate-binding protein
VTQRTLWRLLATVLAIGLVAAACTNDDDNGEQAAGGGGGGQQEGGLLEEIRARGELRCGVNDAVPGFGFVDEAGTNVGFDVDFCKVIATAILGDPEAIDYRPIGVEQRFTALQSAEIDVLVRNTTWTATRDGAEGAAFATTTFYDGQGIMVNADSGFEALEDLDGAAICVLSGTTTELNLASVFNGRGIAYEAQSFPDNDTLREAFIAEQCDAWTSDKSQLAGVRSTFPDDQGGPDSLTILDETISKEPLGPLVRDGDQDFFDAVNWAVLATIQAEEFGITSANVDDFLASDNPAILRFLGQEVPGDDGAAVFDPQLDLDTDFAQNIVREVGNYGEIYDRHIGPTTPLGLSRGLNNLWTADPPGLLYAPPYV